MSDTFEFIDGEYATSAQKNHHDMPSIVQMCVWLRWTMNKSSNLIAPVRLDVFLVL